jgi:hypothetical protein
MTAPHLICAAGDLDRAVLALAESRPAVDLADPLYRRVEICND